MLLGLTWGPNAGLGFAAVLLQVQLGLGLLFVILSTAIRSNAELAKQFEGVPWAKVVQTAAEKGSAAPLLAAFALIQFRGNALDPLSWVGLLTATVPLVLGAETALLGSLFGRSMRVAGRAFSVLSALGEFLLIFGAVPAATQLLCATVLVRLALIVHGVGSLADALAVGPFNGVFEDLLRLLGLAPVVASLALLDYTTIGAGSLLTLPTQPLFYVVLASLALVCCLLLIGAGVTGAVEEAGHAEFELHYSMDSKEGGHFAAMRRGFGAALYAALGFAILRAVLGTYSFSITSKGLKIEWADLLTASACSVEALLCGIYIFEFLSACAAPKKEEEEEEKEEEAPPPPTIGARAKALIAPAQSLVLAMLALQMGSPDADYSILTFIFKHGFLLAAMAVWLQVLTFLVFALAGGGAGAGKKGQPLDTLDLTQYGKGVGVAAGYVQQVTLILFSSGLVAGMIGMGVLPWMIAAVFLSPFYLALTIETRQAMFRVISILVSFMSGHLGDLLATMGEYLEKRRQRQEALAAQKAAMKAAALAAEVGEAPESKKSQAQIKTSKPTKKEEPKPKAKAAAKAPEMVEDKAAMKKGSTKKKR